MTPRQRRGMAERLNLFNEDAGVSVTETPLNRNPCLPHKAPIKSAKCFQNTPKRRIPHKPSPAQIERFEALRARVIGIPESR